MNIRAMTLAEQAASSPQAAAATERDTASGSGGGPHR